LSGKASEEFAIDPSLVLSAFTAELEYQDGFNQTRSSSITFTAKDSYDAVASVIRFWIGRQFMPEFYNKLLCVKIYGDRFGPITKTGQLFNGTSFPFLEWKIDTAGMPFETFAISKMLDRLGS
jgi:hypothetical protein